MRSAPIKEHFDSGDLMSALRAGIASFLESPSGAVKAGDLPVHVMRLLDTDISAVQLSDMTMEKQRLNHGDLTDQDYAVLPELLADPTVVLRRIPTTCFCCGGQAGYGSVW